MKIHPAAYFTLSFLLLHAYIYRGIKLLIAHLGPNLQVLIRRFYWGAGIVVSVVSIYLMSRLVYAGVSSRFLKHFFLPSFFIIYASQLFCALFLLLDDMMRCLRWTFRQVASPLSSVPTGAGISRSDFLIKAAMAAATVPVFTIGYGIVSGAHDYRVRRVRVRLPHLPSAFHGLRIGQLSDIHSGSFFNKKAVKKGIELLLCEKTDLIFFTGDLVNDTAEEVKDYIDIFGKVKAPLGVYSTLGNHDYGDYVRWPSNRAKQKNFQDMCVAHQRLGWQLLLNNHQIITQGSDQLAVIGVENWSKGRFSKYGRLDIAYRGTEEVPIKLLLSHDPSHWDTQVRSSYPDIDITFSGHTHGFQMGIEVGPFRWSPAQYLYKQWAGLYQEGVQYLYVNRGYGYIGCPCRIGIWPEVTVMELEKA